MAKQIKIADLVAEAKLDNRRFKQSLSGMKRKTDSSVGSMIKKIAGLIIAWRGISKAIDFVKKSIIGTTASFESLNLRFEQLIGNATEAKKQFGELVAFSTKTPFKIQEVIEAAATLEAFGASSKDLIGTMGDLAAFMGLTIPEASAAFGRAFAAGAGAADILRERGVLNLIKLQTGIDDLTKLTLPEFRKAMIDAMADPNGRIAGGAEKLAATLAGKWSTFVGEVDLLWVKIGDSWLAEMKRMVDIGIAAVRTIRDNFGALKDALKEDFKVGEVAEENIWDKFLAWWQKGASAYGASKRSLAKQLGEKFFPETMAELKRFGDEFDRNLEAINATAEKKPVGPVTRGLIPLKKPGIGKELIFQANVELDKTVLKLLNADAAAARLQNQMRGVAHQIGAAFRNSENLVASLLRTGLAFAASSLGGPLGIVASGIQGFVGGIGGGGVGGSGNLQGSFNALNANISQIGRKQDIIMASVNIDDRGIALLVEKAQDDEGLRRG